MDHTSLEIFLTIAATKNINKAASSLFMAPTTVSARLKALENELGFMLFQRGKGYKTIELTEKGNAFLPYAERWMELWNQAVLIKDTPDTSCFSISSSSSLLDFSINIYHQFVRDHPSLHIQVSVLDSNISYSLVQQGKVDVGFVMFPGRVRNVHTEELFKEELVLAFSSSYSFPEHEAVSIHAFPLSSQIMLIWNNGFEEWYNRHIPLYKGGIIQVNAVPILQRLFDPSSSWAIVPYSVAVAMKKQGLADFRHIVENPPRRSVFLIWNEQKKNHPLVKNFCSYLDEYSHYFDAEP